MPEVQITNVSIEFKLCLAQVASWPKSSNLQKHVSSRSDDAHYRHCRVVKTSSNKECDCHESPNI